MKKHILTALLGILLATQVGCCRVGCFVQRVSCRLRPYDATRCCTVAEAATDSGGLADIGHYLDPPTPPPLEE
jgi:hypothetical protein